jgi:hypothetical protein
MTKFEAETNKVFRGRLGPITAKEKIANAIDDRWIYSSHWKQDDWVEQAKVDLIGRICEVKEELDQLLEARILLDSID